MDESNPENQPASQDDDAPTTINQSPQENPAETAPAAIEPTTVTPSQSDETMSDTPESDSSEPEEPAAPAQPTVQQPDSGKKPWLVWLLLLIIIAALAAGGWLYYQHRQKALKAANAANQSKDIPLLKIGFLQADFGNLYPDIGPSDYSFSINDQMFEGLVRYENKTKIVPDLASNWTNPDSKTWVFTVKSGIKFHDGHTLTANDVKYSIDKIIASKSELASTFASTIASVDVSGNTVKITTTDPDPTLLNKLTFLYVIDANAPKGAEPSLAGTGPYEIKPGTQPTSKSVQMVAFDGYHGGRPTTREVSFNAEATTDNLVTGLKNHKYDLVGYILPSAASKVPNASHFTTALSDVDFVGFNTIKPGPLQNKLVREAIRYAINAKAIGQSRGSQVTPLSQMIPPSIPGYNPAIKVYQQDIAKAKQLLAQAGYSNGLTLSFSTSSGTPQELAEVTKELKAVGITLTIDNHKDFNEFVDYFTSGKAEMFTVDYSSDTLDGLDIYTTTLQSSNYNNPKLTALFDQASTTVDPAKRLKLLQDAAVIIDQDIPAVPISTEQDLWLMDKNYSIQQDLPSSYLPAYIYKVHQ